MQDLEEWYWIERARSSFANARAACNPAIAGLHMQLYGAHLAKAAAVRQVAEAEATDQTGPVRTCTPAIPLYG